jgi:hypothetical protein
MGLVLAALLSPGCRRPSVHAAGSGYGAGIARQAWSFGNEPQARGSGPLGVEAPSESYIGRVKQPPARAVTQAGHTD